MAAAPSPGAPSVQAPADSDGDGMPDAWELNHFGNLSHDGNGDYDGDGVSDLAEYLSGTDPLNPNDGLRIEVRVDSRNLAIRFNASAGQTYSIQSKTNVNDIGWVKIRDIPAPNVTGSVEVVDSMSDSESRFYRVVTPEQP